MLLTAFDEARREGKAPPRPIPWTVPELLDALVTFRETHCLSQTTMAELCGWSWRPINGGNGGNGCRSITT